MGVAALWVPEIISKPAGGGLAGYQRTSQK